MIDLDLTLDKKGDYQFDHLILSAWKYDSNVNFFQNHPEI